MHQNETSALDGRFQRTNDVKGDIQLLIHPKYNRKRELLLEIAITKSETS